MTEQHPITPPQELAEPMTEHIATAPKDGTKILCICSDGKTRYCWWFGCSDVDGFWMTEEAAEPVTWYPQKGLPLSLAEEALVAWKTEDDAWPVKSQEKGKRFAIVRRALERLQELEGQGDG